VVTGQIPEDQLQEGIDGYGGKHFEKKKVLRQESKVRLQKLHKSCFTSLEKAQCWDQCRLREDKEVCVNNG